MGNSFSSIAVSNRVNWLWSVWINTKRSDSLDLLLRAPSGRNWDDKYPPERMSDPKVNIFGRIYSDASRPFFETIIIRRIKEEHNRLNVYWISQRNLSKMPRSLKKKKWTKKKKKKRALKSEIRHCSNQIFLKTNKSKLKIEYWTRAHSQRLL